MNPLKFTGIQNTRSFMTKWAKMPLGLWMSSADNPALQRKNKFSAPGMRKFTFSLKKWLCGFGDGIPFCCRTAPCLPLYLWLCSYITILESSVYIFYMFSFAEHETKLHSKGYYGFALAPFSIPSFRSLVLILSKIIDWIFRTGLDWRAMLQAGFFTVAQGKSCKSWWSYMPGG